MKAKIRSTGEVVEIITYTGYTKRNNSLDTVSYIDSNGHECIDVKLNRFWDFEDIDEANRWRDVGIELPEFNNYYLVKFRINTGEIMQCVAEYVNESVCAHTNERLPQWYVYPSNGHKITYQVTHWMPLPQ